MTAEATTEEADGPEPAAERAAQSRFARAIHRGFDAEERRRVMGALALRPSDGWWSQFAVMQALAVVVAVMGLSADSAAVVIGAMLLAPLMVPVLGLAAAISMAMPRQMARSLLVVVAASLASIAGAFLLSMLIPQNGLADEVLARTSPDLRDLFVALAAGAAGAYATVRPDVSTSLPGVAVAVALVPPLAAVGMTLEAGRTDLATGAALLYGANLAAIVFVGVVVFLSTGFVPPRRLREKRRHVVGGGVLVAVAMVAVSVPLGLASVSAARSAEQRDQVGRAVDAWLQGTAAELDQVRLDGDVVSVRVSGPSAPTSVGALERSLQRLLGADTTLEVRWTQTRAPSDSDDDESTGDELDEARVDVIVATWLRDGSDEYELVATNLDGDELRVEVDSPVPPPEADELVDMIRRATGVTLRVAVDWIRPGQRTDGAATLDDVRREVDRAATSWAEGRAQVDVRAVGYDGERVTVELLGPAGVDTEELERELTDLIEPGAVVVVRWVGP